MAKGRDDAGTAHGDETARGLAAALGPGSHPPKRIIASVDGSLIFSDPSSVEP
jgi:hypothetical protein